MSKTQVAPSSAPSRPSRRCAACRTPEAEQWAEDGTIPSLDMGTFRMVNLARFRADLIKGKNTFDAGDYSHE